MKNTATTLNTKTVLFALHEAISVLKILEANNEVIAPKMEPAEANPLGSRKLIVTLRQNLEAASGDIKRGIMRDHRGYEIGNYSDLADIISREEDLSDIIDR